jgi:hypothetical protein
MLKHRKSPDVSRPYDRIHTVITKGRKRLWWLIPASLIGVGISGVSWLINTTTGVPFEVIPMAILQGIIGFLCVITLGLVGESLGYTDSEKKFINQILEVLNREHFSDELIAAIDKRAEIGSSAGQIRTLSPLLILPIMISAVGVQIKFPPYLVTIIVGLLVLIVSTFFKEVDRANSDVIIRHAIAEYRCTQETKKGAGRTEEAEIRRLIDTYVTHSMTNNGNKSQNKAAN